MIGRKLAHYQILARIGAGGMGVVFRARDEWLDRDVALKVLPADSLADEAARKRFHTEALALSRLNHPHICTIYEVGEEDGQTYIAMEYIEGRALSELVHGEGLPVETVIRYGSQMADALDHAHARGIVHRDLKGSNVMVTRDGRVKVLDFGLAKRLSGKEAEATSTQGLTEAGTVMGTLAYMAPEVLRGEPADPRADLWALGVLLYEAVAGVLPFQGKTGFETSSAILRESPAPLPPRAPAGLRAIVQRCLAKDPAERYARAGEVRAALETVQPDTVAAPVAAPQPASASRRTPLLLGALGVVATLALLLLLIGVRWTRQEAPSKRITLAVLPFHTLSAPQEIRFLGIGIPDAIITRLAKVERVLPRPTSAILRYENQSVDPKEVGRALQSEYVLTGIVQNAGDRLRVSVQLVRARDGSPVWGEHYDLARSDLLQVQDAITEQLTSALRLQVATGARAKLHQQYTQNPEAYEAYLRGRAELVRLSEEGTRAALASFESALQLDPQYALARAGLAQGCAQMRLRFAPQSESESWGKRAEMEARRVLELDPNLAEAHEALAAVYRFAEFDWERTIEESRRALQLNPGLDQPHFYLAAAFWHLGLVGLMESEVRLGLETNPANRAEALRQRGIAAVVGGRYQEATALLEEVQSLTRSRAFDWWLGQAYYYQGERTRAEELLAAMRGDGPADRRAQATLAAFLAARGEKKRSNRLLEAVTQGYMDHHVAFSIGLAHTQLGNRTEALRFLRQAVQTGLPCYPWYEGDLLLQPLRADPEFQALLAELRKSWQAAKARYEP